jgi:hypothetical protein
VVDILGSTTLFPEIISLLTRIATVLEKSFSSDLLDTSGVLNVQVCQNKAENHEPVLAGPEGLLVSAVVAGPSHVIVDSGQVDTTLTAYSGIIPLPIEGHVIVDNDVSILGPVNVEVVNDPTVTVGSTVNVEVINPLNVTVTNPVTSRMQLKNVNGADWEDALGLGVEYINYKMGGTFHSDTTSGVAPLAAVGSTGKPDTSDRAISLNTSWYDTTNNVYRLGTDNGP